MNHNDLFPMKSSLRDIPNAIKSDILKKLCPLMKENRKVFWRSKPTNDNSENLIDFHREQKSNATVSTFPSHSGIIGLDHAWIVL